MADHNQKIIDIIVDKLGVKPEEVTDEIKLTDLGADSLDAVELIMEVEKLINIAIPDDEAEKISTVGDLKKMVAEKTK